MKTDTKFSRMLVIINKDISPITLVRKITHLVDEHRQQI